MTAGRASRLARLINLVPYFIANPGISPPVAAAELGVSEAQLFNDLNQLWMCGLPGYGPGDLIDLSFSEESIEVTFSAGVDRPLRLTSTEATALLIALRSLVQMPGMVDPSAAEHAIAKIEAAAGAAASSFDAGSGAPPALAETAAVAAVRSAVGHRTALRMTYYSASRDAVSERTVDPINIVLVDDQSYLQAWCRSAEGVRLFRLDRIDEATELAEPSRPPIDMGGTDALELFRDDTDLPIARLAVSADHSWILDYYPMTHTGDADDGSIEVTMRFAALDWMARLVLGFGSGVRVLAPTELIDEVATRARAALAVYDGFESTENTS